MFTSIFFFIVPYSTGISTLSLHDALPISALLGHAGPDHPLPGLRRRAGAREGLAGEAARGPGARRQDRKSTRLNSSHSQISYAVFCLKKKVVDRILIISTIS